AAGGYVLAGGASSRMGTNKAFLPWQGSTLVAFVASQIKDVAGSVATVGGPPIDNIRHVPDRHPGFGPVGGIATALADSAAEWNLIAACDMPGIDSDLLRKLLWSAHSPFQAVVPVTGDGRCHPLCAVYHLSARANMEDAITRGNHKLRDVVASLKSLTLPFGDMKHLTNVNTPEQWAAAAQDQE
ncbi:MAG: molybdenum cofactor guanylyltransferase, partial [Bryobacteraceae bacterium]|nr:molybdenum cofactor guanylyltransferase [Bryobacteraceae bacterium]